LLLFLEKEDIIDLMNEEGTIDTMNVSSTSVVVYIGIGKKADATKTTMKPFLAGHEDLVHDIAYGKFGLRV
jgi:hypothetical protein